MTRRDYVALAEAIEAEFPDSRACSSDEYGAGQRFAAGNIARRIADLCARDNPRFDRERFLLAAGVSE